MHKAKCSLGSEEMAQSAKRKERGKNDVRRANDH